MKISITKVKILVVAIVGCASLATVGVAVAVHAASRALPSSPTYAALGDSIAAGAGLPTAPNASTEDTLCARSLAGYPSLLAADLHTSVTNLTCSGARDDNGIISAQALGDSNNTTLPSQLDRAFSHGTPNLITITIGANDVHWTQFLSKCYVSTCGDVKDTAIAAGYLTYFQGKLAYTLHQIKDRSGTSQPPKVLVTGYYNPISSTSCLGGRVSSSELRWINNETTNLNKAIQQTISATTKVSSWFKGTYNFAAYVPLSFSGHGICSSNPWVQGLSDAAPLHPTTSGEVSISNALYTSLK